MSFNLRATTAPKPYSPISFSPNNKKRISTQGSIDMAKKFKAGQTSKKLDFGRLFETDSKVNCTFCYLDIKGALNYAYKIPGTVLEQPRPHPILGHKEVKIIMRDINRVNSEAEQHNTLTQEQRKNIMGDLTILLRDNVQRGDMSQVNAQDIANGILDDNGVKDWKDWEQPSFDDEHYASKMANYNRAKQLDEHYSRAIEPLTKKHEGWHKAYEIKLDRVRQREQTPKEFLKKLFNATTLNYREFTTSYHFTGWNSREADNISDDDDGDDDDGDDDEEQQQVKTGNVWKMKTRSLDSVGRNSYIDNETKSFASPIITDSRASSVRQDEGVPVAKEEEDHLRIIVSGENLKRKISRSWIHPLVQLPPKFLWDILILYGFMIIILKLTYQLPLACPCYRPWEKSSLNNWEHLSTYSFYPYCNASYSQSKREQCEWNLPTTTAQSKLVPYDHLLGIKKVYAENVIVDDVQHILNAQSKGLLLNECILSIITLIAMIIHSTRLKQQKSYDILRFMRNPTIFNDTIGFGSSHQHMFSTDREKENGGGGAKEEDEKNTNKIQNLQSVTSAYNSKNTKKRIESWRTRIRKRARRSTIDKDTDNADEDDEEIQQQKDEEEPVQSYLSKMASPVLNFAKREYFLNFEPEAILPASVEFVKERPKPGVDWYRLTFLSQALIFVYVLFFQLDTRTMDQWANSTLNIGYVAMLSIVSILMAAERMMYLYRAIVMKTLIHVFWVVFVVVMVHSNVYTDVFRLEGGESLRWFAIVQLPYFFFSAMQISYGYPPFVGGRLVVESEDWYAWALLYLPFRGIPFLYEIKILLDYFCTETTFYLQDFVKYEDIRSNIYVIGVNLDWVNQELRTRGQPRPFCSRCCSGGLCFTIIWLALFLPLFLFTSSGNLADTGLNKIEIVSLQISISTFPDFFSVDTNIEEEDQRRLEPGENQGDCDLGSKTTGGSGDTVNNITTYACLEKAYPFLRNIPYSDKKEYENKEVQQLSISTSSGSNWPITVDSRNNLIQKLQSNHSLKFSLALGFARANGDTRTFTEQYDINKAISNELIEVLSKSADKPNARTYITLPNFLPTFVRLPRTGQASEIQVAEKGRDGETTMIRSRQLCLLKLGSPLGTTGITAIDLNATKETESKIQDLVNSTSSSSSSSSGTDSTNTTKSDTDSKESKELLNTVGEALLGQTAFENELNKKITELSNALNFQKQDYWSIQCGVKVESAIKQSAPQYFYIYAISAQVSLGQFLAGGIISLYTILVVYMSSFIRGMFTGGSANTMFYDWPRHDTMKQYVVKIAECRSLAGLNPHDLKVFRRGDGHSTASKNKITPLEAEEEYFRELVDVYRRPDLLYERTGPYRHYFGIDSQREKRFHNEIQAKKLRKKSKEKEKLE